MKNIFKVGEIIKFDWWLPEGVENKVCLIVRTMDGFSLVNLKNLVGVRLTDIKTDKLYLDKKDIIANTAIGKVKNLRKINSFTVKV